MSASAARQRVAGSCGAMFARKRRALEFVGVDGTQYPRREHPLEQPADPLGTVPGSGDPHEPGGAVWGDRERGDRAGAGADSVRIRPGSGSAATFRYSGVRPPAVILKACDRAGAQATGLDPEVPKRRGQQPRMVVAHVRGPQVRHGDDRGSDTASRLRDEKAARGRLNLAGRD
jgi:hypothetical protein